MGQIIPRSMLLPQTVTAKLKTLGDDLKALAAKETNTSPAEWYVRDALPKTDFEFNTEKWLNQTLMVIDTFTKDWSIQLPDNKYVVFYGVILHELNPTIYGVQFKQGKTGATAIDAIQFQKLKEEDNLIGFFDKITYRKKKWVYVEYIADAATAQYAEEVELLCLVAEMYGELVSSPDRMA